MTIKHLRSLVSANNIAEFNNAILHIQFESRTDDIRAWYREAVVDFLDTHFMESYIIADSLYDLLAYMDADNQIDFYLMKEMDDLFTRLVKSDWLSITPKLQGWFEPR